MASKPFPAPALDIPVEGVRAARQHYLLQFGRPSVAFAFRGASDVNGLDVEVGVFGTHPAPIVHATAGASMRASKDGVHREWAIFARGPVASDPIAALLARVAATTPAPGDVIDSADVRAFSSLDAVVLLPAWPVPEAQRTWKRRDGVDVTLAWVVPVSAAEAKRARDAGADALWHALSAAKVDVFDLKRDLKRRT